jgi:integrase
LTASGELEERPLRDFALYLSVERGLAPRTVKAYADHVSSWLDTGQAPRPWLTAKGGSPSSFNQRVAALQAWAKHTSDRKLRRALEDIDRPKRRQGKPRPVLDWRLRILNLPFLWQQVAIVFGETGVRIDEACNIAVEIPPPESLTVMGKGEKERTIPLSDAARRALTILGGRIPWGRRQIQKTFSTLGFTPHQLRHTLACELIASGADLGDVQEILGHASPATARIYAAYSQKRLRTAMDRRQET